MKDRITSTFFLKLSLALLFIAIGIMGLTSYNSDMAQFGRSINKAFGGSNDIIPIAFAVFQLVAGVILAVALFTPVSQKFLSISLLIIFIVWALSIAMDYFIEGLFQPDFIRWLANVSPQLVILSGLWIVYRDQD